MHTHETLQVINENCLVCFEVPKEHARIKMVFVQEQVQGCACAFVCVCVCLCLCVCVCVCV